VVIISHILGADVARFHLAKVPVYLEVSDLPLYIPTVRACHLVAAKLFDEWVLALVAMPYQGCRHGFFDDVS
jgi:hypothetical protein